MPFAEMPQRFGYRERADPVVERPRDGEGTLVEALHLEDAHRPVPQDRPRVRERAGELLQHPAGERDAVHLVEAVGEESDSRRAGAVQAPQHFLYFWPLPHGHGSFLSGLRLGKPRSFS